MSNQTRTVDGSEEGTRLLGVATLAGVVAGLSRPLVGVFVAGVGTAPVELHHTGVGLSALAFGLHLVFSVGFGAVFIGALAWVAPRRVRRAPAAVVLLGVGFGVALWLVNVAVGWPLLQSAMGLAANEVPHLHSGPLVVHGLYGLVLGAVVATTGR
jgi:hypothetical protein